MLSSMLRRSWRPSAVWRIRATASSGDSPGSKYFSQRKERVPQLWATAAGGCSCRPRAKDVTNVVMILRRGSGGVSWAEWIGRWAAIRRRIAVEFGKMMAMYASKPKKPLKLSFSLERVFWAFFTLAESAMQVVVVNGTVETLDSQKLTDGLGVSQRLCKELGD
ncbi:hypothetical protein AAHA92_12264 [Salvia divinorum]|uniref:Uncharacterized protein n=1 Tax=Salvia divinorum TaxID=28513 RepID=A0ABD1HJU4_SALDI